MDNDVCKGVGLGPEAYFRNFPMGTELKISLTETSRGGGGGLDQRCYYKQSAS